MEFQEHIQSTPPRLSPAEIDRICNDLASVLSEAPKANDGCHTLGLDSLLQKLEAYGHSRAAANWAVQLLCENRLLRTTIVEAKVSRTLRPGVIEAKAQTTDVPAVSATDEFWARRQTGSWLPRQKEVILLVHGIRTFAGWQPMVKRVLEEIPNTKVIGIKYGYLNAFCFWCPFFTRQSAIDDLRRQIQDARAANPETAVSVIAHSFGTYAISRILTENPDITFNRLVLSGSIIPRSYRWDYVRSRLATDVLNDYGTRDVWPVLAKCLSWGYGDTGRHGFGRIGVTDRGHDYAHSDFFNQEFVRQYWKPWFERDKVIPSPWEEQAPPASWFLSVLSVLPFQWIITLLLIAVALWLGIKVIPPVEPIPVSGNFEIPQGTPSDSKPLGQDFPAEDLLNVVNDSQRDISSRSAALSRLLRAKAIPDSAALSLISGLIDEASAYWSIPETDRPKVDAATAILEELATAVVVSPASMDFVLQNAKDSLNTDLAKNRDSSKAQRRLELWFQFFRKGFFGQPNVSFDFLNDAEFLAHHLCTLDRLLVNLTEGEARMLLASKVAGVRLLGSLQVAHDDRLQKDATFYSDAIEVIQQILDEPLGAGESSPVPAAVFDALIGPYGTFDSADKFVPSAIRILLDEKSHLARLANEYVIDNKSNRAVRDRFNSAVNYLKGACKYRKYSSDAESALREFLEKQAQAIAQLSPEKVERGKGDDRILASLDVLFEMNDAMLPLNERGKPDGRLQPGTIAVIDRLLGLDPKLLENLNLDHRRKRWLELKALQGHVLLRATMQSKTSLTKVHQSRVKML